MRYHYVFFDVANTLLYKKDLYQVIAETLEEFDIEIEKDTLVQKHKLLSEIILSPEKTSEEFYQDFNSQLLYVLGIIPTAEILDAIYRNCVNLPWKKFHDTHILKELNTKLGVISNWDEFLPEKLKKIFDFEFDTIVYSSTAGIAKPNEKIFIKAISKSKAAEEDILYVGDSVKLDIEPALKAGLQAVLIDRSKIYPYFKGMKIESLHEIKDILNG